jgi:hypothetical protein
MGSSLSTLRQGSIRQNTRFLTFHIDRIHLYFAELNADPVIFRWKYKMDEASIV